MGRWHILLVQTERRLHHFSLDSWDVLLCYSRLFLWFSHCIFCLLCTMQHKTAHQVQIPLFSSQFVLGILIYLIFILLLFVLIGEKGNNLFLVI